VSRRTIGLVFVLLGSEVIGVLAGEWFYGIFQKTVPPAAVAEFTRSAAHGWFLLNGAFVGLVVFGWALVVRAIAPVFRTSRPAPPPRPASTP
jgi:hypothetical protein